MAYDPTTGEWKPENADVGQHLTGLLDKNNPLMQQAGTQGAQAANRRGLMNSSMGVQAGQTSRVSAALPMAQQQASQAHQANQLGRQLQTQHVMDRENREFVGGQAGLDRAHQQTMQQADLNLREMLSNLDREAQERIATMNVAASERQASAGLAASFEGSYAAMVASIMENPDIPADVRQTYIEHAGRIRDSNLRLVEQFYGITLDWGAVPGASGSGSNTPPPGPAPGGMAPPGGGGSNPVASTPGGTPNMSSTPNPQPPGNNQFTAYTDANGVRWVPDGYGGHTRA